MLSWTDTFEILAKTLEIYMYFLELKSVIWCFPVIIGRRSRLGVCSIVCSVGSVCLRISISGF